MWSCHWVRCRILKTCNVHQLLRSGDLALPWEPSTMSLKGIPAWQKRGVHRQHLQQQQVKKDRSGERQRKPCQMSLGPFLFSLAPLSPMRLCHLSRNAFTRRRRRQCSVEKQLQQLHGFWSSFIVRTFFLSPSECFCVLLYIE